MLIAYLLVFVVIAGMLYTTYSQQRRAKKAQAELLRMLKKGDEVLTIGGIFGIVRKIGDDYVDLEIANRTTARFVKRAIREIVSEEEDEDDEFIDEEDDYVEEPDEDDEFIDEEGREDAVGDEDEAVSDAGSSVAAPTPATPPELEKS